MFFRRVSDASQGGATEHESAVPSRDREGAVEAISRTHPFLTVGAPISVITLWYGGLRPKRFWSLALFVSLVFHGPLSGSGDTGQTHFRRAGQLAQVGKLDAAIGEYLSGLKAAPDAYDAYNNLGVLYFQKQEYPQAIAAFREADRLQPKDPEISFNLGLALFRSGDYKAAIAYLILGIDSKDHS